MNPEKHESSKTWIQIKNVAVGSLKMSLYVVGEFPVLSSESILLENSNEEKLTFPKSFPPQQWKVFY